MEDVKTKREARRRKILENSDKRLQKITRCKLDENDSSDIDFGILNSGKSPNRTY